MSFFLYVKFSQMSHAKNVEHKLLVIIELSICCQWFLHQWRHFNVIRASFTPDKGYISVAHAWKDRYTYVERLWKATTLCVRLAKIPHFNCNQRFIRGKGTTWTEKAEIWQPKGIMGCRCLNKCLWVSVKPFSCATKPDFLLRRIDCTCRPVDPSAITTNTYFNSIFYFDVMMHFEAQEKNRRFCESVRIDQFMQQEDLRFTQKHWKLLFFRRLKSVR